MLSDIRQLLEEGDADLRASLGETVQYRSAGGAAAVELCAVLSPLPEAMELTELGGAVIVSTVQAVVSKADLSSRPRTGDRLETEDGRRYIVNSVTSGNWDTSWHILLRLADA